MNQFSIFDFGFSIRTSERNKIFLLVLCVLLFPFRFQAEAQQTKKIPRIGYLNSGFVSASPERHEAFRQGLHELGYIDGKNIVIEYRVAEGSSDRLAALAAELVRLNVELIVASGPPGTRAAKKATVTIPIVMAQDPDPVGSGFVASLARPGGNITGLSSLVAELGGKRLELLNEIIPRLSRVAVLGTSANPTNIQQFREIEAAARPIGVSLEFLEVVESKDIESGFQAASKIRANALLVLGNPVVNAHRTQITDLAVKHRLPAVYGQQEFVEAGGLMFYGASITELFRRAATYVDKILKGAKPADLPVEQPKKFEFIINLKTAKQIGLTIPPNVLARADKVIK
jgi:putative ABC transport system substrate-binding protein